METSFALLSRAGKRVSSLLQEEQDILVESCGVRVVWLIQKVLPLWKALCLITVRTSKRVDWEPGAGSVFVCFCRSGALFALCARCRRYSRGEHRPADINRAAPVYKATKKVLRFYIIHNISGSIWLYSSKALETT